MQHALNSISVEAAKTSFVRQAVSKWASSSISIYVSTDCSCYRGAGLPRILPTGQLSLYGHNNASQLLFKLEGSTATNVLPSIKK